MMTPTMIRNVETPWLPEAASSYLVTLPELASRQIPPGDKAANHARSTRSERTRAI
jgi:hypothetical protein